MLAHGAKEVAKWEIKLDSEAQLKALERFVKADSFGKVFGDNEVIDQIGESRVSTVTFYKLKDGSGVQVAKIEGGENAMLALLSKADMDDLNLTPQYRQPKPVAAAPQTAKLNISGTELTVALETPKVEVVRKDPLPLHRVGGAIGVPMHNPVAAKAFLARAWTANSMALPSSRAEDMPLAAIVATSPEAHPSDDAWPAGIRVTDVKSGESIVSPARAVAMFQAALEERVGPVISRDDLVEQMRARKAGPK